MSDVTPEDVEALIRMFDASDWDELRIGWKDFHLYLSRDPVQGPLCGPVPTRPDTGRGAGATAVRAAAPASPIPPEPSIPDGLHAIRAPNLGTFYRSPKPGAAPFVEPGQKVDVNTEVCIIEVMKLFTAVRAGVRGTVRKVLVDDAEMVEFNQPLILIEPVP
jgi:acetyl-CoA carboxylase biotin carboxyl carrier protein